MKFFKYTILALASLGMATTFTACSEDDTYEPGLAANGVLFSPNSPTSLEVSRLATSFSVTVARTGATNAASYAIVATTNAPEGVFTFPATVSFAEGATDAKYEITYNPDLLTETYNIDLSFGADATVSPYGLDSYKFTVKAAALMSAWAPYLTGEGTYGYLPFSQQFGLPATDPGLPIYSRTSLIDENEMEFVIDYWSFNSQLYMAYNKETGRLTVPKQPWNQGDSSGNLTQIALNVDGIECPIWLIDLESYAREYDNRYIDNFTGTSWYDEEEGQFVIGIAYAAEMDGTLKLLNGGYGQEFFQLDGFANAAVSLEYIGMFTDKMNNQFANFKVSVGEGASKSILAASTTVKGEDLAYAIARGTVTGMEVAPGIDQTVQLPINGAGKYDAAIVSWKNDEPNQYAVVSFTIKGFGGDEGDADWKSHGVGEITDGWITSRYTFNGNDGTQYSFADLPWEIMIEQNVTNPALYRMVNPWSDPNSLVVYQGINEDPEEANVLIDCTNPNCVKIEPQYSGLSMTMPQEVKASKISVGDYSFLLGEVLDDGSVVDESTLIEFGYNTVLEDGVVYVPQGACRFGYNDEFGYAWVDKNGTPVGYGIIYLGDPDEQLGARQKAQRRAADLTAVARAFNPVQVNFKVRSKDCQFTLKGEPSKMVLKKK